jgi:hypothetical protein
MKRSNEQPAFPDPLRGGTQSFSNQNPEKQPTGLTKREYFAGLIMQGLCANANPGSLETNARYSVQAADMLLAELENN